MLNKIDFKNKFEIVRFLAALLIALTVTAVIIISVSDEPSNALFRLLLGPLQSTRYIKNVFQIMIPLLFTGLAALLIFRIGVFNLAIEGMFYAGGLVAAIVGILFTLPSGVHWIIALIVGGVVGSIVAFVPAALKHYFSANEVVSSLMLNYIIFGLGNYLLKTFISDENSTFVASLKYQETSKLPQMFGNIHVGLIIIIILLILAHIVLYKTRWGYEYRITAENNKFAKYSGVKITKVFMIAQLLGGFIAGVGGGAHILGSTTRFSYGWESGFGWDGIVVAIIARYKPSLIPLGALILAYIRVGSDIMSRGTDVESEVVAIIQGIIIVLLSARGFLKAYRQRLVVKEANLKLEDNLSEEVSS